MLIKERRTLWFGRHPSAQAVWNLTAAWANGASYAFGETRYKTQRRVLMSLVDLSRTRDEWERCRQYSESEDRAALGGRWFIFFLNFMVYEGWGILRWVKLDWHAPHRPSAGSQYRVTLQMDQHRAMSNIFTLCGFTQHKKDRGRNVEKKTHTITQTIKWLFTRLCPGSSGYVVKLCTMITRRENPKQQPIIMLHLRLKSINKTGVLEKLDVFILDIAIKMAVFNQSIASSQLKVFFFYFNHQV